MSGLLSHISVRRTTDVWRTPGGPNDDRMTFKENASVSCFAL